MRFRFVSVSFIETDGEGTMDSAYWMIPAGPKPILILIPIFAILLGVTALLGASLKGSQKSRFELTHDALRLHGDLYGRTIPYDHLRTGDARIIDMRGEPALQPVSRRLGTGLPGYSAGWFRLRNGEKALLYVTDRTRVLYIPTTDAYGVMLSPRQPDEMLAELRRRAGS
jgi:Bacterial PH domain